MQRTKIDWCDYVWNPVTGCSKASEGCQNCYAEAIAKRFWGERKFTDVKFHPETLNEPMKLRKPGIIFVNSMSDLFHPEMPFELIDYVFVIMQAAIQHIFIILTKRPDRMLEYYQRLEGENRFIHLEHAMNAMDLKSPTVTCFPFPNVWLGVSVENQKTADERIPLLLQAPAVKRIVCVEPMLGPVELGSWVLPPVALHPTRRYNNGVQIQQLNWIICGKETGTQARPFNPNWAKELKMHCDICGIPFWWKGNPEFQEMPA